MSVSTVVAEIVVGPLRGHPNGDVASLTGLPEDLRMSLAGLTDADGSQVLLANDACYVMPVMANGLDLDEGDGVVIAANDFPSDILPWVHRRRLSGIILRSIRVQPS